MALNLRYYFRETFLGLRRNAFVAFSAVSTAFIALFFVGGALLLNRELNMLVEESTRGVEVAVYLQKDISVVQRSSLGNLLTSMPEVARVEYESPQEAYQHFLEAYAEQSDLVENVSPDALPASFEVKLKDPEQFAVVAQRLEGQPGIEKIRDNREFLEKVFAVIHSVRIAAAAIAAVMLFGAAMLIGNTVRMAVFARRREIGIMRLVGATKWHIRMPFLLEAVLEGVLGAGVAILGLLVLKLLFIDSFRNLIQFVPLVAMRDVVSTIPFLLGIGAGVAVLAALVAMRRHLQV